MDTPLCQLYEFVRTVFEAGYLLVIKRFTKKCAHYQLLFMVGHSSNNGQYPYGVGWGKKHLH